MPSRSRCNNERQQKIYVYTGMYVNEYVSTMHECICMQLSSYLYLYLYLYPSSLSLYRLSLYIYIVIYVRWNSLLIKTIQGLAQGDVQMHRRSTKNTEGYASSQVRGVSLHPSRISAVTNQLIVPSRCESQGNGLVSDFLKSGDQFRGQLDNVHFSGWEFRTTYG